MYMYMYVYMMLMIRRKKEHSLSLDCILGFETVCACELSKRGALERHTHTHKHTRVQCWWLQGKEHLGLVYTTTLLGKNEEIFSVLAYRLHQNDETPGKTETSENGILSGDFKNGDFESGVFPCVNTQKRKRGAFSAGSHVVSLDKMAMLEAFHMDPTVVTHASLVNFMYIQ